MQKALRMCLKKHMRSAYIFTYSYHGRAPQQMPTAPSVGSRGFIRSCSQSQGKPRCHELATAQNSYSAPASEQTFTSSPMPSMRVCTVCPGFNH